jgi:hypothetical protein
MFLCAAFYDGMGEEEYRHKSPADALEEVIVERLGDETSSAQIAGLGPIEIVAYRREDIDAASVRVHVVGAMDVLDEGLAEQYGSRSGEGFFDEPTQTALTTSIFNQVLPMVEKRGAWHCERSASRLYSLEDIQRLLRDRHPTWFARPTGLVLFDLEGCTTPALEELIGMLVAEKNRRGA